MEEKIKKSEELVSRELEQLKETEKQLGQVQGLLDILKSKRNKPKVNKNEEHIQRYEIPQCDPQQLLDKISNIVENFQYTLPSPSHIYQKAIDYKQQREKQYNELCIQKQMLKERMRELRQKQNDLQDQLCQQQKEKEIATYELNSINDEIDDIQEKNTEIESIRQLIKEIKLEGAKRIQGLNLQFEQQMHEMQMLNEELKEKPPDNPYIDVIDQLRVQYQQLESCGKIAKLQQEVKEVQIANQQKQKELQTLKGQVDQLKNEYNKLNQAKPGKLQE